MPSTSQSNSPVQTHKSAGDSAGALSDDKLLKSGDDKTLKSLHLKSSELVKSKELLKSNETSLRTNETSVRTNETYLRSSETGSWPTETSLPPNEDTKSVIPPTFAAIVSGVSASSSSSSSWKSWGLQDSGRNNEGAGPSSSTSTRLDEDLNPAGRLQGCSSNRLGGAPGGGSSSRSSGNGNTAELDLLAKIGEDVEKAKQSKIIHLTIVKDENDTKILGTQSLSTEERRLLDKALRQDHVRQDGEHYSGTMKRTMKQDSGRQDYLGAIKQDSGRQDYLGAIKLDSGSAASGSRGRSQWKSSPNTSGTRGATPSGTANIVASGVTSGAANSMMSNSGNGTTTTSKDEKPVDRKNRKVKDRSISEKSRTVAPEAPGVSPPLKNDVAVPGQAQSRSSASKNSHKNLDDSVKAPDSVSGTHPHGPSAPGLRESQERPVDENKRTSEAKRGNIVGRSSGSSTTANSKIVGVGDSSSSSTAEFKRNTGEQMLTHNFKTIPETVKKSIKFSALGERHVENPEDLDQRAHERSKVHERIRIKMFQNAKDRIGKANILPVWPNVHEKLSYRDVIKDARGKRYDKHWLATTLAKAMLPAIRKSKNRKKTANEVGEATTGSLGIRDHGAGGLRDKNLLKLIKNKASKTDLKEGQILVCKVDDRGNVSIVDAKRGMSSEDDSHGYDVGLLEDVNSVLDHQVESQSSHSTNLSHKFPRHESQSHSTNLSNIGSLKDNINLILSKLGGSGSTKSSVSNLNVKTSRTVNNLVSMSNTSSAQKLEDYIDGKCSLVSRGVVSRGSSKSFGDRSYEASQRSTLVNGSRSTKPHVVVYRKNGRDIIVCIPREKTSLASSLNSTVNSNSKAMSTSSSTIGASERRSNKVFLPARSSKMGRDTYYQQYGNPKNLDSKQHGSASSEGDNYYSYQQQQQWQLMQAMQGPNFPPGGNPMQQTGNGLQQTGNPIQSANGLLGGNPLQSANGLQQGGNGLPQGGNPIQNAGIQQAMSQLQQNQFVQQQLQGMGIRLVPSNQGRSWIPVMEFCPPYVGFPNPIDQARKSVESTSSGGIQTIPTGNNTSSTLGSTVNNANMGNSANNVQQTTDQFADQFGQPFFLPFGASGSVQTTPRINGVNQPAPNFFPTSNNERRDSFTSIFNNNSQATQSMNANPSSGTASLCFPPLSGSSSSSTSQCNSSSATMILQQPGVPGNLPTPSVPEMPSNCSPDSLQNSGSTSDSPETVSQHLKRSFDFNNLSDGGYENEQQDGRQPSSGSKSCNKQSGNGTANSNTPGPNNSNPSSRSMCNTPGQNNNTAAPNNTGLPNIDLSSLVGFPNTVPNGGLPNTDPLAGIDLSSLLPNGMSIADLLNVPSLVSGASNPNNVGNNPLGTNNSGSGPPASGLRSGSSSNTLGNSTPLSGSGIPNDSNPHGVGLGQGLGQQHFIGIMNGLGEITLFNNALQALRGTPSSSTPGGGAAGGNLGSAPSAPPGTSMTPPQSGISIPRQPGDSSGNNPRPTQDYTGESGGTNPSGTNPSANGNGNPNGMAQVRIGDQIYLIPASAIDGNCLMPMSNNTALGNTQQ